MKTTGVPPRIMGLDVGETRIGVAVSDPLGLTAQGVEVIRRVSPADDLTRIACIARQYEAEKVVVGFPRNMNGSIGKSAHRVLEFISELKEHTGLEVVTMDERLTTAEAERLLIGMDVSRKRRKKVVDKTAACLILQTFLDKGRRLDLGPPDSE